MDNKAITAAAKEICRMFAGDKWEGDPHSVQDIAAIISRLTKREQEFCQQCGASLASTDKEQGAYTQGLEPHARKQ